MFFLLIIGYIWFTKQDSSSQSTPQSNQARRATDSSTTNRTRRSDDLQCVAVLFPHTLLFTSHFSPESNNSIKIAEFDQLFLQHYISPGAPNMIILLLIADKPNDSCIGHFQRQISAIKEYVRAERSSRLISRDWKKDKTSSLDDGRIRIVLRSQEAKRGRENIHFLLIISDS